MSRRILVADDSSTIQKVIKIAFSRYPVEMVEAASFLEALTCLSQARPEALILDASLPGTKGPGDFAKLAEDSGGVPVLLLVGTYETIDEAQFRASGFHYFLRKPFDSNELVGQIDQMLGGTLGREAAAPRGDTIPPGGTQRPAHATVIHAGGLGEVERSSRMTAPPPPPGHGPRASVPPAPPMGGGQPPPPPGRRSGPQVPLDEDDDVRPMPPPPPGRRSGPQMPLDEDDDVRPMPPPPPGRRSAPQMRLDEDDDVGPMPTTGRRSEPPMRLEDDDAGGWAASPPPEHASVPPAPSSGRRTSGPPVHLDDEDMQLPAPPRPRAGGRSPAVEPPPFSPFDDDAAEQPRLDLQGFEGEDASGHLLGEPLPLATDERRKGRRAFDGGATRSAADGDGPAPRRSRHHDEERSYSGQLPASPDTVPDELVERLEAQLPALVREAVEAYCERHFKSLAREVIAAELRRLADEKARHLVDP